MDWKRFGRLALIGAGVLAAFIIIPVLFMFISDAMGGGGKHESSKQVDLKVVTDNSDFYWGAVYLPNSPTQEACRKVAKEIADREFKGRYGQVQVFDDEWARSMVMPENRGVQLSTEEEARWDQHLRMTYVYNAKGYWYDR